MDKFKKTLDPIAFELDVFEKEMEVLVDKCNNFLCNDLKKILFGRAKRLRPIFIFLFSKILGIENKKVLLIALISEIIHSASLIHDDIIDEEKTRRDSLTLNQRYGSKLAVLEGDLLLSLALKLLSETNFDILKIYSNNIFKTINGEIEQNSFSDTIISEEKYLNKTLNKTGNIFLSGLESLFTLTDIKEQTRHSLINYMKNYSLAFQIKNDIEDIKKENYSDIKNGNYTLPVIYYCKEHDISHFSKDEFERFKKTKNKYQDRAYLRVLEYKKNATGFLNIIKNNIYKDTLLNVTEYTL